MRLAKAGARVRNRTERETARGRRIGGDLLRRSILSPSAPDLDSHVSVPASANLAIMQRTRGMLTHIIKLLESP
jgi:hypothetical protein